MLRKIALKLAVSKFFDTRKHLNMSNQNDESHGNDLFFFEKFEEWAFYRYINKDILDNYNLYKY